MGGYLLAFLPAFDRSLDLATGFAGLDAFAPVVLFLAFRERQLDLRPALFRKINPQRDEGEPFLLRLPDQLVDFLPMQQQLAGAQGIVIHDIAVAVRADVTMVEKDLAVIDGGVAVLEIHPAIAQRLHFSPAKHHTRLQPLFNEVVVVGLPIGRDDLVLVLLLLFHDEGL